MDRKVLNNLKLDDTEALTATIQRSLATQGHTEYVIRVQRGPLSENCWTTKKRYNDFVELQLSLQATHIHLPLPPKKLFGNMEREFVNQRQQGLQNYLNVILSNPLLADSLPVKRFLDPANYFHNFQEKGYQQVLMMFRSDPNWNVIESIPDIGWRIRKHYFLVRHNQNSQQEFLLSRSNYGTDICLNEKELNMILKHLSNISSALIFNPNFALADTTGGVAIYKFQINGSLKDCIFKAKPREIYFKKYKPLKVTSPLSVAEIKSYGKQILEALQELHTKGFPYGHLHSGNVFIDDGVCRLSSLESIFLGLPPFYRNFAIQLKKVKSLLELDVYSFGHILYEMTFGESLGSPTCDLYPVSCPPEIKSVLESILTSEACKGGLPTVDHLLTHPLFSSTVSTFNSTTKSHLRMTSQMQDLCKAVHNKVNQRLLNDQQLIRKVQRLQHAQSILREESRMGFKRNSSLLRKSNENGLSDTRSASPVPSTGNSSNGSETQLHKVTDETNGQRSCPKNKTSEITEDLPVHNDGSKGNESSRSSLLNSIQNFNSNKLKKTAINDRSEPRLN